ncbi:hypothetical protein [Streptomyces sp. NPDC058268]
MSPALDERDRIRAAMDRIMKGTPEHSNGALTSSPWRQKPASRAMR